VAERRSGHAAEYIEIRRLAPHRVAFTEG
jgi:hypothetical protein